jgi:hypothetical protein
LFSSSLSQESVNDESVVEEDNFIAALEWGEAHGVEVVSASLGYTLWYTYPDHDGIVPPISRACDLASKRGVVIVVANGMHYSNDTEDSELTHSYQEMMVIKAQVLLLMHLR